MFLSLLRPVILSGMLLAQAVPVQAIRVQGHARDAFTRLPMHGVIVLLEGEGVRTEQRTTRIDGFYRFDVPAGGRYIIRFAKDGLVPRQVVFDVRDVPREWVDALEANLDMRLFPPLEGMDSSLLSATVGMATWDPITENLIWDSAISGPLVERWNTLLAQHAEAHPEVRPTKTQRWALRAFELARGYGVVLAFLLLGLLDVVARKLLDRLGRKVRMAALFVALVGAGWLVVELAHDAGPLRSLAFVALVTGLTAAFHLVMELWVGGTDETVHEGVGLEEEVDLVEEDEHAVIQERSNARWKGHLPLVVFFAALFTCMFEWRWGLENTLNVWSLVGMGTAVGLVAALVIAWSRTPAVVRWSPLKLLVGGGLWWGTLPLLGIATASFVNRSFPQTEERCHTWPVVD
ncbi:MAG: hypothetical protein IT229_12510, partial [Flavobacteriales bacterium]|nr:hypothetical protein [Flavobacteriales bacterium]